MSVAHKTLAAKSRVGWKAAVETPVLTRSVSTGKSSKLHDNMGGSTASQRHRPSLPPLVPEKAKTSIPQRNVDIGPVRTLVDSFVRIVQDTS